MANETDIKIEILPILRGQNIIDILRDDFLIDNETWIAGGFARWAVSPHKNPHPSTDIDIFCRDEKIFNFIASILDKIFKIKSSNPACIAYNKEKTGRYKDLLPIQLIRPREDSVVITKGNIRRILANFDFPVTRAAIIIDYDNYWGMVDSDFVKDEMDKRLHLKIIHCPISSTFRVIKYCKKGYKITMREVVKLFSDWSNRPQSYRDQLLTLIMKEDPDQDEIEALERLLRID